LTSPSSFDRHPSFDRRLRRVTHHHPAIEFHSIDAIERALAIDAIERIDFAIVQRSIARASIAVA